MSSSNQFSRRLRLGLRRFARRLSADNRGATAVEFAMVVGPFFLMVMALTTIGMQYLTLHSLEHGVSEAARKLRTGEAQKQGLTLSDFRTLLCDAAGTVISCDDNNLVIHIKSASSFAGLAPLTTCLKNGALTPSGGLPTDSVGSVAGEENKKVLVTACYNWSAGSGLWQTIWSLVSPVPVTQGKTILTAAAAFQTEPYK